MMSSEPQIAKARFCSVAIYLYGDSISLDAVTALVGLTPTRSRNRGDVQITSAGSRVVQKIGMWSYRRNVSVDEVAPTVIEFIDLLKCGRLVGQAGIEKAELDVFVVLGSKEGECGINMEIPTGYLARLSELGVDLLLSSDCIPD